MNSSTTTPRSLAPKFDVPPLLTRGAASAQTGVLPPVPFGLAPVQQTLGVPPVVPPKPPTLVERAHALVEGATGAIESAGETFQKARTLGIGGLAHIGTQLVTDPRNALANWTQGFAKMSVVPDAMAPKPDDPDPIIQGVAGLTAGLVEGAAAEWTTLKTLGALSRGANPRVAKVATRALEAVGQGKGVPVARQVAGSAALGVGLETVQQGVQVATGDKTLEEAAQMVRPAAIVGGTLAGAALAPTLVSEVARRAPIPNVVSRAADGLRKAFTYEPVMSRYPGPEVGTTMADVIRAHTAASNNALSKAVDRVSVVLEPVVAASKQFASKKEVQKYGQKSGDIERLTVNIAEEGYARLKQMIAQVAELRAAEMRGDERAADFAHEILQDHIAKAGAPVREAYNRFLDLADEADAIDAATGDVIPSIMRMRLPEVAADFEKEVVRQMYRRYNTEANARLLGDAFGTHGIPIPTLPVTAQEALAAGQTVAPYGTPLRTVSARSLPKSMQQTLAAIVPDYGDRALPVDIATRLEEFGFKKGAHLMDAVNTPTNAWKTSILFWGGSALQVGQAMGDLFSMARSFPGLFLNPKNYTADGPWGKAAEMLARKYRLPGVNHTLARNMAINASAGAAGTLIADPEASTGEAVLGGLTGAAGGAAYTLGKGMAKNRRYDGGTPPVFDLIAHHEYHRLADSGLLQSGMLNRETAMGRSALQRLYAPWAQEAPTYRKAVWDTARSILGGSVYGQPMKSAADFIDGAATVARERENYTRLVSYLYLRQKGFSESQAVRQASNALIDYEKFGEVENRFLRGALLPFYSWVKGNTVNNVMSLAGRDPGGLPSHALAATGGLIALDVAAQAWNEMFDEEQALDSETRNKSHIILGWPKPLGGEGALRDDQGRAIVAGVETPFEQTLELVGLARPGVIWSQIFGKGMPEDDSLIGRAMRIEDFNAASEIAKAPFRGAGQAFKDLLTPALALPSEFITGESLAFGSPIISEYVDDSVAEQWLKYAGKRVLAAYQAGNALYRETHNVKGEREPWNFYTSRVGAGLPADQVDLDRAMKYRLGDMMELAAKDGKPMTKLERQITDIVYRRGDLEVPRAEEMQEVWKVQQEADTAAEQQYLMRYYGQQIARRSRLSKQWDALDLGARERFLRNASKEDVQALVVYLNGGSIFNQTATEAAPVVR